MNKLILTIIILTNLSICTLYSQEYKSINVENLSQIVNNSNIPTYVVFYIPNCATAKKMTSSFCKNYSTFQTEINFIFIAITNKNSIIDSSIIDNPIKLPIFKIENKNSKKLEDAYLDFTNELCDKYRIKRNLFASIVITKTNKIIYQSELNNISIKKTKKILKKLN